MEQVDSQSSLNSQRRRRSIENENDGLKETCPTPPPNAAFRSLPIASRNVTDQPVMKKSTSKEPPFPKAAQIVVNGTPVRSPSAFSNSISNERLSDQPSSPTTLTNSTSSSSDGHKNTPTLDIGDENMIEKDCIDDNIEVPGLKELVTPKNVMTEISAPQTQMLYDELLQKLPMDSEHSGTIMSMDVSINAGSRSPSVLSSQEYDSSSKDSEKKEKEMLRMKHLNFLLDQHHRRIAGGIGDNKVIWTANNSGDESSRSSSNFNSYEEQAKSEEYSSKGDGGLDKSFLSESGKSLNNRSTKGIAKDSSSSLFENFDRTWSSLHNFDNSSSGDDVGAASTLEIERLCFASLVHILLRAQPSTGAIAATLGSVPVDVVKLFWNRIIIFNSEISNTNALDKIASILHCLTERLRYTKMQISDDGTETSLSLSHDVYAQYAKYIFECDGITQENIDQWNLSFVGELQNVLLSDQDGFYGDVSPVVKEYAAKTLPSLLVNAMSPVMTTATFAQSNLRKEFENECISNIVILLSNQRYLEYRMNILGSRRSDKTTPSEVENDSDSELRMKGEQVLRSTVQHIKELEGIIVTISKKTDFVLVGEEKYDVTRAGVTIYNAWKDSCKKAMDEGRVIAKLKNGNVANPSMDSQPMNTQYSTNRRFKRSSDSKLMLSYAEACLTWKPKQFLPKIGDYTLDDTLSNIELIRNSKNLVKSKGKLKMFGKRAKENRPTMALSELLDISVDLLSFEICIGKAFYLIGESLAAVTSSKNLVYNRQAGRTIGLILTGPNACTAKLSCCATALETYIRISFVVGFLLSDELRDVDEDDLVDLGFNYEDTGGSDPSSRMKKLIKDRETAVELMGQLDILIAEGFFALANHLMCGNQLGQADAIDMAGISIINNLGEQSLITFAKETVAPSQRTKPSDISKVLQCYQLSMHFLRLGMPELNDEEESESTGILQTETTNNVYDNDLDVFKIHQRILHTAVLHAFGIYYYEHSGDFRKAKTLLDDCISKRQLLLRQLRQDENDTGNISSSSTGSTSIRVTRRRGSATLSESGRLSDASVISSRRGRRRNQFKKRTKIRPVHIFDDISNPNYILLANGKNHKDCLESIELDLSSTMEFSGLASHGLSDSEEALSLFQEALILRALHSGKNCLDVADLNYNMAVIHDDNGQYEASLGRYGESLRVRFSHLENLKLYQTSHLSGSVDDIEDIERSAVLTLRCMTNVYHALSDYTNAVSTNLKAIEILKEQIARRSGVDDDDIFSRNKRVLGFGRMNGNKSNLPFPRMVLDEVRSSIIDHPLPVLKNYDIFSEEDESLSDVSRKEISELYEATISILDEMKESNEGNTNGYNSSIPSSRFFLSDHHSMISIMGKRHINQEHVRLDATFNLGLIAMHFREPSKAIGYLEQALRTLWINSPGDSSGESSDSEASSSNFSNDSSKELRQKPKKTYVEGQTEEGILYHALALCHTALSDDERAIRCYITALRYYRRRFGMLSMIVSGALYDCATSYWNLCDFNRAEDFWADCLRILLSQDIGAEGLQDVLEMDIARTLYNIAATKVCKGEYFDQYSLTCLHDALGIFKKMSKETQRFSEEVAHSYFNLSLVHYNRGLQLMKGFSPEANKGTNDDDTSLDGIYSKDIDYIEPLKRALSCVDDALNAYLSGNNSSTAIVPHSDIAQLVRHPMQAHVSLLMGHINNALGSATQAAWNYKTSIRLLNKVYTPLNLYSASALYELGNLEIKIGDEKEALKYYEECLDKRVKILGDQDTSVADVLFKIGGISANMSKFSKALEMEKQCLKIRMEHEGSDGDNVAIMLFNIGLIYCRSGEMRKSLEYLEGALNVRKTRIAQRISMESQNHNYNQSKDTALAKEESQLASILHYIGNVYLQMEDSTTAMKNYQESLCIWNRLCEFGPGGFSEFVQRSESAGKLIQFHKEYLRDMADTYHNLGGVYETKSDYSRALACYNKALIIKRNIMVENERSLAKQSKKTDLHEYILSSNTLSSAITLLRIGAIHAVLQNFEVALSYYKSALKIQRQHLGRDHIAVGQTLYEIGVIVRHLLKHSPDMRAQDILGMEKAAVKYFKDSLAIAKTRYGSNHQIVATVMFDIGSIHDRKGDYEEALSCYQHAVRVYGSAYAKNLCRDFFDASMSNTARLDVIAEENQFLFNPKALNGYISTPYLEHLQEEASLQLEQRANGKITNKDRDSYVKASLAFASAAAQAGVLGTNTFEVFVYRFLHYVVIYGVDPIKESMQNTVSYLFGNGSSNEDNIRRIEN